MDTILKIMLYIWQLPQNIVGLIMTLYYKTDTALEYKGWKIRVCKDFPGGISLGNYVFVRQYPFSTYSWNTVKHEWGHTRQSLILGPLYLFVIGIPSAIWAATYKYEPSNPNKYFTFYTERWADKLGEVCRGE